MPDDARPSTGEHPRVLMLGKGWFPNQLGGLNRYFCGLLEHQTGASGVVVGPVDGAPDRVVAVSRHDAPLLRRLFAFGAAAHRAARCADLVDVHFALYAFLPLLSRRLRGLPLMVHFQGPWAEENVAQGDGSTLRCALRRALERAVYRRAARVVVLSSAFRRLLVERYGVSPWRVRVEPPGVDLGRFSPGDRDLARDRFDVRSSPFVVVCVRRLVPRMGLDVLIDAWAQAQPELAPQARLLIAGEGPMSRELQDRIAKRGVQDSVRLLGRVDDDALADLYRAADTGVVPTRSFEGFGLVVIEAAACGTPTIVTSVGGLPEAVAGLDRSLVVAPGDVSALRARIAQAATSGGLPSRGATRRFADGFSWAAVADRHRAVHLASMADGASEPRLRVVFLDHVAQLSGGELALLRLVPHLTAIEPHVVLAEDGPLADELAQVGISSEVLPMAERARGVPRVRVTPFVLSVGAVVTTAVYVVRLALRLRSLRPDLVHTNSLKAGFYGSIAARLVGVPVVWHVRDRIASDYLPPTAVRMIRVMTRKLPAAVIANSYATMATLDRRARLVVIPSAVAESASPAVAREPRPFTVGMIGRLAPWKGQDLFLRAFAQAFPGGDQRCVLVGSALFGEDEFEQRLHSLAGELALDGRVEFRGFRSDVSSELARMDILVHASLTPEPFGQVVIEGMAAGVPVIAADAGGPAEIVDDGVNGVLYPIGDQQALAARMRELADAPERRRVIAVGGVAAAAAYHPNLVATRVERLYEDVLVRSGRGL